MTLHPSHRLLAAAALLAAACGHGKDAVTTVSTGGEAAPAPVASTLGPGDVLEVRVFQEPELSGIYQVGTQGDVIFPLCKSVMVGGLTANAAAETIRRSP